MSFIAPLSPPDEHISTRPSSSKAHTGGGSVRLNTSGDHLLGPPRTVDRKRTGLRKTRTESSLPTPPRTRERVGRSSTSPDANAGSSASTRRRATSSSSRPFDLPSDQPVGGLFAAPTIESSSSSRTASHSTTTFGALSPPLTGSTRVKKRHPAHRQLDSLGPTRRAALKGGFVSVDWKAPPPPAFFPTSASHEQTLPPLPTSAEVAAARLEKLRRNRDPTKGPIWEEGNPFLEGMGLRAKGLVSDKQRVGALEEKETIGYVFRGTKTVFANPFYTGETEPIAFDPSVGASELDMGHPDFSPIANPPPRLLFPALGRGGHKASSTSASARSRSQGYAAEADEDDDDEDELAMQAVPRRLFSGGQPGAAEVDNDNNDQSEDEMAVESSPAGDNRRGRATGKRSLDAFGGPVEPATDNKRQRLSTGLHA